jgi:hypothetical protein
MCRLERLSEYKEISLQEIDAFHFPFVSHHFVKMESKWTWIVQERS